MAAREIYSNKPQIEVEALLRETNETVNRNMHACKAAPNRAGMKGNPARKARSKAAEMHARATRRRSFQ
jgi:hypothetical protein